MLRLVHAALLAAVVLATPSAVFAQGKTKGQPEQPAQRTTSFIELIRQGYKLIDVTFIPLDAAKRAVESASQDEVIVSLQKDYSIAVCLYSIAGWMSLQDASMESEPSCDFRTYAP